MVWVYFAIFSCLEVVCYILGSFWDSLLNLGIFGVFVSFWGFLGCFIVIAVFVCVLLFLWLLSVLLNLGFGCFGCIVGFVFLYVLVVCLGLVWLFFWFLMSWICIYFAVSGVGIRRKFVVFYCLFLCFGLLILRFSCLVLGLFWIWLRILAVWWFVGWFWILCLTALGVCIVCLFFGLVSVAYIWIYLLDGLRILFAWWVWYLRFAMCVAGRLFCGGCLLWLFELLYFVLLWVSWLWNCFESLGCLNGCWFCV